MAGPLHFFAVVGAVHDLVGTERPGHAHVGFVAKDIVGPGKLGLDGGHHELGRTRPQADHRKPTAGTANLQGVDRLAGNHDGQVLGECVRW
ncbi:hypothetical protein D3C77_412610 [compost metagenome]